MERIFDIILSSLALLVCFPLMLPLVIILKSTGEGEIFFIQDRIGKKGKVFGLFKFATMLKDSPNIGCLLYTSPSPRDPKTSRMPSSA